MSRKIAFTSLGCDKNRVDSEVMLGILQKNGYTAVADEAEADIIVVNTCCFIKDALEESIETILEMSQYKNPDVGNCKGLIVAGCLGQRYEKEFFDELPEVDAIIGTTAYESIAEVADEILGGKEQVKQLESIDLDRTVFCVSENFRGLRQSLYLLCDSANAWQTPQQRAGKPCGRSNPFGTAGREGIGNCCTGYLDLR